MAQRKPTLMFGKLHNLTTFSHDGKKYRKTGSMTAIREDNVESVFYPDEWVRIEQQPPRTMMLWQVREQATITAPSLSFDDNPVLAKDLEADATTPVTIL